MNLINKCGKGGPKPPVNFIPPYIDKPNIPGWHLPPTLEPKPPQTTLFNHNIEIKNGGNLSSPFVIKTVVQNEIQTQYTRDTFMELLVSVLELEATGQTHFGDIITKIEIDTNGILFSYNGGTGKLPTENIYLTDIVTKPTRGVKYKFE